MTLQTITIIVLMCCTLVCAAATFRMYRRMKSRARNTTLKDLGAYCILSILNGEIAIHYGEPAEKQLEWLCTMLRVLSDKIGSRLPKDTKGMIDNIGEQVIQQYHDSHDDHH